MKRYLFDLFPSGKNIQVKIDRTQPYLRDHDVGVPLFGTVLSLEAMAECTKHLKGNSPLSLSQIIAGNDCLVPENKALSCSLQNQDQIVTAALTDEGALVFSCRMGFAAPPSPPKSVKPKPLSVPAQSAEIYRCFFHGPSLQVVTQAYTFGQFMIGEMNEALPPLLDSGRAATVIPMRTIEFCLQTAGLLDAAFQHTMSVPLAIDRIDLYSPSHTKGVWSAAQKAQSGTDIHAFNEDGEPVLSVLGYRTKPMPYESNHFHALCKALTRT